MYVLMRGLGGLLDLPRSLGCLLMRGGKGREGEGGACYWENIPPTLL